MRCDVILFLLASLCPIFILGSWRSIGIESFRSKSFHRAERSSCFWYYRDDLPIESSFKFTFAIDIILIIDEWIFNFCHFHHHEGCCRRSIFLFFLLSFFHEFLIFTIFHIFVIAIDFINHGIDLVLVFQCPLQLLIEISRD